ncbi:hypothetical protein C0583_06805 [Candidatus Parcubacteria bacterium]|nr:MAG: hypothetical protein C0583_06805 [Candidatus Parcubacteria bacterium]
MPDYDYLVEYVDNSSLPSSMPHSYPFSFSASEDLDPDETAKHIIEEFFRVEGKLTSDNCGKFGIINLYRVEEKLNKVFPNNDQSTN